MTGIDLSPAALARARLLAAGKGVACRLIAADLTGEVEGLDRSFDFAYDWEVLHHVFPEDRPAFVANVARMLRPGGRYLSVCFSERDRTFDGEGHYRQTRIGTHLYFSCEDEMRALFAPLFAIERLETVEVEGKTERHTVIATRMTRSA
jgi:SAM-dependent methyltransferase